MWPRVRAWCRSAVLFVASAMIAAPAVGVGVASADHNFTDVPEGAGYHDFVDFLVQSGITSGCGAGVFCPTSAVTRGQMAIFLQKLAIALDSCPPDSVKVGPTCIDKYEASVWEIPAGNVGLIEKIKAGTATLAELQAGGFQRGVTSDDYGAGCPDSGIGCENLYAVSIAGVMPSGFLTWFQAAAVADNAGKRLPTNAEWQVAALGTPIDEAACRTGAGTPVATGAMAGCVSDVGALDMVGNLYEWVADWVPRSVDCQNGSWGGFSEDRQCLVGAATDGQPGALLRGGAFLFDAEAGVFDVLGGFSLSVTPNFFLGFRGAR